MSIEEKYKNILESIDEGYFEVDLAGNLTFFNDSLCRITGYGREELPGMNNRQYASPETAEKMYRIFNHVFRSGDPARATDYEIIRKDGSACFLAISTSLVRDPEGKPVGFRGMVRDITEWKGTERALRKSEERYRLLVDNAGEGIFIDQDDAILFPNPKALEILGYSAKELAGIRLSRLVHPHDLSLLQRLQEEEGSKREETSILRLANKAGAQLWLELSVVPIIWEGDPAFLNLFKDITLQKKLEAQLVHAQKMEAIGTLAGGIAHNFNNLLMSIQGNISLMLLDMPPGDPHFERLAAMEKLIESGSRLTGQLLGYARGEPYQARLTDLNRLVEETSHTFGLTKKEIVVHLNLFPDLRHVSVDQAQIGEVLINLFVNAADAMPGGGDLYISTRTVTEKALQGKPFKVKQGAYALIQVRDAGTGMDAKTMERVFDPFFTTKSPGRGTGLGLASAYGIVKAHDGYIDVASEKGVGTRFSVYLPASLKRAEKENEVHTRTLKGKETLLLVDDEEDVLKVAKLMLERLGYRVLSARSAEEAVALFAAEKDAVQLAILDMVMPDMGGGRLYEKLKDMNPGIKALLSSGYGIDGQAMEILNKGCNGFIQKPFGLADLSRKVREIIDGIEPDTVF